MSTAEFDRSNLDAERGPTYTARELVPHLAHELRQPLSTLESISCYLELIVPVTETKAREQICKMQELLHQTDWILSDAIHFLCAAKTHPVLVDWNEILTGIASEGDATAGEDIEFSMDESIPPVFFDLEQAKHLALGMFLLLRRVSHGNRLVRVSSKRLEECVLLEFSCSVPPKSSAASEEWFRPFHSLVPAGSGLALAGARQIVQSHGGTITLHSGVDNTVVCAVRLPFEERNQADIAAST